MNGDMANGLLFFQLSFLEVLLKKTRGKIYITICSQISHLPDEKTLAAFMPPHSDDNLSSNLFSQLMLQNCCWSSAEFEFGGSPKQAQSLF
jgi:hypothetical protein